MQRIPLHFLNFPTDPRPARDPKKPPFLRKFPYRDLCDHFASFHHSDEENGPCEKSQVLGQRSGAELLKEIKVETPDPDWSSEQRF